jgi:hypothetical protein
MHALLISSFYFAHNEAFYILGYNILKPSLIANTKSSIKMHKGTIKSSSTKVAESKSNLYSFSIHLWHFSQKNKRNKPV